MSFGLRMWRRCTSAFALSYKKVTRGSEFLPRPPSPLMVENLTMRVIEIMISFRLISGRAYSCVRVCVSIRRYPLSSGWMIEAESCVKCACVLSVGDNVGVLVRS